MRCAIYIRVSTNREEQETSIRTQKDIFLRLIGEQNWDIYKFYIDIDSGTSGKRKELQNMIEDAKSKKFDLILSKELSRLARNGQLSYQIRDIALEHRIHIMTLDNAINTLEGNNSLFGLYAWMYETESQNTSNRVKSAYVNQAKKGRFKGSTPPYGYKLNSGKLEIREDYTPQIVQRIYKEYLSGIGCDTIAKHLFTEGIVTPSRLVGKKDASDYWNGSTVKKILTNPHYVGNLVQCRETTQSVTSKRRQINPSDKWVIVPNTHEPIISQDVYDTVQTQISLRTRNKTAPKVHLFTNYIYCAECKKAMWYKENSKGYMCGARIKHGSARCTNNIKVRERALEDLILHDIKELSETIDNKTLKSRLILKQNNQKKSTEKQLTSINNKINALHDKKKKLLDLLISEVISSDAYQEGISDIQIDIHDLNEQRHQLESVLNQNPSGITSDRLLQQLKELIIPDKLSTELLHRLVKRIEIKADGTPRIYYNFSAASAV